MLWIFSDMMILVSCIGGYLILRLLYVPRKYPPLAAQHSSYLLIRQHQRSRLTLVLGLLPPQPSV